MRYANAKKKNIQIKKRQKTHALEFEWSKFRGMPEMSWNEIPHRACLECGYYDGKEIISSSEKKGKKK